MELLAYKDLNKRGFCAGKAKVQYNGKIKINRFMSLDLNKKNCITSNSVSILDMLNLRVISTTKRYPEWIFESRIKKWKVIAQEEKYENFEYCAFPYKVETGIAFFAGLIESFNSGVNNEKHTETTTVLAKEYRNNFPQYRVETKLEFKVVDLLFSRIEIDMILNHESVVTNVRTDYPWYFSSQRKSKLRKIVELLVSNNRRVSSTELWEVLKYDSMKYGNYDPDCIILEVGNDVLYLKDGKEIKIKTFVNLVSKCNVFLDGLK